MRRMLAASAIITVSSAAAWADDKGDCRNNKNDDVRIAACSVLIQRDPKDALAYHHRGLAYQVKGNWDGAIADYTKAIELRPNYPLAYESRGRAYASKGDYTHAVADVTRAGELTPKAELRSKATTSAARKKIIAKPVAVAKVKDVATAPEDTWPDWAPNKFGN